MKLENLTLKGALAFFLICVSAFMTILWMVYPPTGDASQIGLLAGFVTLFIKMTADAVGYQYSSSAGSDKKDETQAKVASALAAKVAPETPPVGGWWNRLGDDDRTVITAAAANDPEVARIVAAPVTGKAEAATDIAYLVKVGLLTQTTADAIQS